MTAATDVFDWSAHSAYSDPRGHADLLAAVPPDPAAVSETVRNIIVHYRGANVALPQETRSDIDARWLSRILDLDQARHPAPLTVPREEAKRVQGCCRDHSLLATAILRQHGIPARNRVGFASYFAPGYNVDHVIVEYRDGDRWRRFEPEVMGSLATLADPLDVPAGPQAPFLTAAEVWQGHRAGTLDVDTFGIFPGSPISGAWFVQCYVVLEVAARFGDELLLWDGWGAMAAPDEQMSEEMLALTDRLADLLVRSDAGSAEAEAELLEWYRSDERLHPGERVMRLSPFGDPPVEDSLTPPA
jgi:hypothetical protein